MDGTQFAAKGAIFFRKVKRFLRNLNPKKTKNQISSQLKLGKPPRKKKKKKAQNRTHPSKKSSQPGLACTVDYISFKGSRERSLTYDRANNHLHPAALSCLMKIFYTILPYVPGVLGR